VRIVLPMGGQTKSESSAKSDDCLPPEPPSVGRDRGILRGASEKGESSGFKSDDGRKRVGVRSDPAPNSLSEVNEDESDASSPNGENVVEWLEATSEDMSEPNIECVLPSPMVPTEPSEPCAAEGTWFKLLERRSVDERLRGSNWLRGTGTIIGSLGDVAEGLRRIVRVGRSGTACGCGCAAGSCGAGCEGGGGHVVVSRCAPKA